MKVCLFCRYFYPHIGGNETQTMNLARELVKQGVEVMVVTGWSDRSNPSCEEYQGIKIYRVRYFSLHQFVYHFLALVRRTEENKETKKTDTNTPVGKSWIRNRLSVISHILEEYTFMWNASAILKKHQHGFNLIHSQMLMNYGYMALRAGMKLHKPVLIKDASLGGLEKVTLRPGIERKCNLLRKKAYFVAISSKIEQNLVTQGIPSGHVFRIPNGISVEHIDSKNNDEAIPGTILYVGNFWQGEIKGLDVLIRAMGEVVKVCPKARLLVAGEGCIEQYVSLAEKCRCADRIEFLGQKHSMGQLYRESTIFVLPSRQEGMSNATLEAMSWGMPCVVTDVSGSSDQIENGKEGIIVPVEDDEAMAKAIIFLLGHPEKAKNMGLAAKEKIRKVFDIELVASRMTDVYKQILSGSK